MAANRLAMFLPNLAGGGAERVFLDLAEDFVSNYCAVDLVLAHADGPLVRQVPPGVRIVDLGSTRVATSVLALADYFRRERPVAGLSAITHANLAAIAAWAGTRQSGRLVVTEHAYFTSLLQHNPGRRVRLQPALVRRLYPRAYAVVTVSRAMAEDLRTYLPSVAAQRVVAIPNSIDPAALALKAAADTAVHPWLGERSQPLFLSVGRLSPQKDYRSLLVAFGIVRERRECRLIILGEGEERDSLEQLRAELGLTESVSLPGFVENPYPYFAASSVFVLSSVWEGLPTVLLEALALRLPIVSTDCLSGPREILRDGQYGQLVPSSDPAALAHAMEVAMESGKRPPPAAVDPFRVATVVARYANLLGLRK